MLNTEKEIDLYDDVSNPLDGIEEIMISNDWTFDRMSLDEMTVHVSGKQGHYKMVFVWQEDFSALQFCCAPDLAIAPNKMIEAAQVVNKINASLWMGHFDVHPEDKRENKDKNKKSVSEKSNIPCFRHTSLFRGMTGTSGIEHMEDLIDIALHECERYYPSFELLSQTTRSTAKDMSLALMDVAGIA